MRPKAFRARPTCRRIDEYAKPSDNELGRVIVDEFMTPDGVIVTVAERSELAQLVINYRAGLWLHDDRPKRDEVRETLRRLSRMDQSRASSRWRGLDSAVKAEIDRACLMSFRSLNGPNVLYSKALRYTRYGPENLPEVSALAMNSMRHVRAGRPRITALAVAYAAALASYWFSEHKRWPTVNVVCFEPSKFQNWAFSMFERARFPTGDLYKALRDGLRSAKERQTQQVRG